MRWWASALGVLLWTLPARAQQRRAATLPEVPSCDGRAAAFDLSIGVRILDAAVVSLELPEGPRRISDPDVAAGIITTVINRHRMSHLDSEQPHPVPLSVVAEAARAAAAVLDWIARLDRALSGALRARVRWVIAAAAPSALCAFPFRVGKPSATYHRWDEVVAAARRNRQPLTLGR